MDLKLFKKSFFFLLYVFNLSLLLSPYGHNINDSTNFLLKEEIFFAKQKNQNGRSYFNPLIFVLH